MFRKVVRQLLGSGTRSDAAVALAKQRWRAGERDAALALLRERCASQGDDAAAHRILGSFLIERARELHAISAARRMAPTVLSAEGCYREAVRHLQRASTIAPGDAIALRNLGLALRELGELSAAHVAFAEAHSVAPDDPDLSADLAYSLQCRGRTAEAIALYENAIRANPENANAHAGLALSLLGAGEFARGWDEYEWRLRVPGSGARKAFPFPRWRGEDLSGRCLLVTSEQGIGDEIMFASCFDELISRAGHCVLEVSVRLAPLIERSFPGASILVRSLSEAPDWSKLPKIDLQIAAGSVPQYLRRSQDAFPARERYLQGDPGRIAYWQQKLRELGAGAKVGIAWTGGLPGTLRAARSLPLEALRPLIATPGAQFVALEFLNCGTEVAEFNRKNAGHVAWWPEAVKTIEETAALVSSLDLVVSVTTATAHLSGALGRPTWVLVPTIPTWRYLWAGDRMPWYPAARILRGEGDAAALVARVRASLDDFLRGR